jgi:hypothetical protein
VLLALTVDVVGPLHRAALASPIVAELIGATTAPDSSTSRLQISSSLPPVWPGFEGTFEARISSPASATAAVRITGITAAVGDASPACSGQNLRIRSYRWSPAGATYTVAPGSTVSVPLILTMPDTGHNQDACQGAVFPISYSLTGQTL